MTTKRRKFTLIELLVVISIIAILAAILLPALQKAKGKVKITTCLNNMKQGFLALSSYGADMEEYPTNYNGLTPQPGNWGDETCGRWEGGAPSAFTSSGVTYTGGVDYGSASTAVDLMLNAKYCGQASLACSISLKGEPLYNKGGWYFGMRPWDSYQTGTFVYNGPNTLPGGLGNNSDMSGMTVMGGGGGARGISYKSDHVLRGAVRYSSSMIPFLGCPSLYRDPNGDNDYRETHHLGGIIMPLLRQSDSQTAGWLERDYCFGDGHARLVYAPVRAGYKPQE